MLKDVIGKLLSILQCKVCCYCMTKEIIIARDSFNIAILQVDINIFRTQYKRIQHSIAKETYIQVIILITCSNKKKTVLR